MRGQDFFASQNFSARLDDLDARLVRRDEVMSLLYNGQKINAIKVYREDTGASLADAKAAVERMELAYKMGFTPQEPYLSETPGKADGALNSEIEGLLVQGKKINAIKLYREQTGLGLREAKEAIDLIENGILVHGPRPFAPQTGSPALEQSTPSMREPDEAVRRLVSAGKKIQAIKLYREQTGLGLREAKEAIDRLAQRLR